MISTAIFLLLSLFTVFTSVSVLGVALGVAALTIVLAVTTGFQQQFRDKVLGVNAHVIVLKSQATFAEYRDVMKTSAEIDPEVIAVQPFIFAEMLVTRGKGELSGVAIKGVDPKLVKGVLDLETMKTTPWPAGLRVTDATVVGGNAVVGVSVRGKIVELVTAKGGKVARENIPFADISPIVGVVGDKAGRVVVATRDGHLAVRDPKGAWTVTEVLDALPAPKPGPAPAESK
jgi:lipoprotein-releasing system permease protein